MLQALHRFVSTSIPIYGMNRGTVGFLMNDYAADGLMERLAAAELTTIHPLAMTAGDETGKTHRAIAFNEVSLLRQRHQAAKLMIAIDDKPRLEELTCDGVLVATPAGSTAEVIRALDLAWPRGLFSLSHLALPFPVEDGLYGLAPDAHDNFGLRLGALAPRGESGVLVMSLDSLLRVTSNPFVPYLRERVAGIIPGASGTPGVTTGRAADPAAQPAR
jgi:hypothetical protein